MSCSLCIYIWVIYCISWTNMWVVYVCSLRTSNYIWWTRPNKIDQVFWRWNLSYALKYVKDCIEKRWVAVDGWLVGLLTHGLRLRMGLLALLWTYLRGPVVVGNGTSLAFHAAMQFHAFFSTERQLRSTLMTATESAHARHAMSQWLIQSMVRICGLQLDSHLCSLQ